MNKLFFDFQGYPLKINDISFSNGSLSGNMLIFLGGKSGDGDLEGVKTKGSFFKRCQPVFFGGDGEAVDDVFSLTPPQKLDRF